MSRFWDWVEREVEWAAKNPNEAIIRFYLGIAIGIAIIIIAPPSYHFLIFLQNHPNFMFEPRLFFTLFAAELPIAAITAIMLGERKRDRDLNAALMALVEELRLEREARNAGKP